MVDATRNKTNVNHLIVGREYSMQEEKIQVVMPAISTWRFAFYGL